MSKQIVLNESTHNVTMGTSGKGMSFSVKQTILSQMREEQKVIVVDPKKEYKELVERLPNKVSSNIINPLAIRSINQNDFGFINPFKMADVDIVNFKSRAKKAIHEKKFAKAYKLLKRAKKLQDINKSVFKEMDIKIPLDGLYIGTYSTDLVILTTYKNNEHYNNSMTLGQSGRGTKIITFKENEFKKDLAPENASIKYEDINGEKFVIMAY